jgi:hypothetical protein
MRAKRDFLMAALVAVCLCGAAQIARASTSYSVDLYNSSDETFELISRTGHLLATLAPGRSLAFKFNDGINLRTGNGRVLHYDRVDPPKEFVHATFLATVIKAQLNADLRIWLVPPAAPHPMMQLPKQPPGFPLTPR